MDTQSHDKEKTVIDVPPEVIKFYRDHTDGKPDRKNYRALLNALIPDYPTPSVPYTEHDLYSSDYGAAINSPSPVLLTTDDEPVLLTTDDEAKAKANFGKSVTIKSDVSEVSASEVLHPSASEVSGSIEQANILPVPLRKSQSAEIRSSGTSKRDEVYVDNILGKPVVLYPHVVVQDPPSTDDVEKGQLLLDSFRGVIKIGGAIVNKTNLSTLRDGQWLDDEIINAYMELLNKRNRAVVTYYREKLQEGHDKLQRALKLAAKHCDIPQLIINQLKRPVRGPPNTLTFSTFFYSQLCKDGEYNYSGVRRWTMRRQIDVFEFDVLIFPVHLGNVHWALGVVSVAIERVTYLDSMGGRGDSFSAHIMRWLEDEWKDKKTSERTFNWTFIESRMSSTADFPVYVEDAPEEVDVKEESSIMFRRMDSHGIYPTVPYQDNNSDCGVFACQFAEAIADDRWPDVIDFSSKIMRQLRKKMIVEIVNERIESTKWIMPKDSS